MAKSKAKIAKPKTFTIKVESYTKMLNPYGADSQIEQHIFQVEISQLEEGLLSWMDTNPRMQNLNSDVSKGIRKSLADPNSMMHIMSNGILFSAESLTFNLENSTISMTFTDREIHGDADGAHMLRNTIAFVKENKERPLHYENISVITGIKDKKTLATITRARNTNTPVTNTTMVDYENGFDGLKDVLSTIYFGKKSVNDMIVYKQLDKSVENAIKVEYIVPILIGFDPFFKKTKSRYKTLVRRGSAALKLYTSEKYDIDNHIRVYKNKNILRDVINLYDYIELGLGSSKFFKDATDTAKYQNKYSTKYSKKDSISTFSRKKMARQPSPLLILLLLYSLIPFVEIHESGNAEWINGVTSIREVWDVVACSVTSLFLIFGSDNDINDLINVKDNFGMITQIQEKAMDTWKLHMATKTV